MGRSVARMRGSSSVSASSASPNYGVTELRRLEKLVAEEFRRQGITFTVYSEDAGTERIWPMDIFPRLIAAAEWDELASGLSQRVAALNCFLADFYNGDGEALADKVVPRWLVVSSQGFGRNAVGIKVRHNAHCNIAGIDVVRGADGRYRVLEDNLRNPSGISYVVENRAAMAKVCTWLFDDHAVQPTEQYGPMLRSTLESMAPDGRDSPHIVVLTPGIFNSAYFEHAFLARSMGVELVEGRDLVVDDHRVYSRTIEGLVRVDVIYRRISTYRGTGRKSAPTGRPTAVTTRGPRLVGGTDPTGVPLLRAS